MKNTVYIAFACLCNDLGLKPRSTVTEEALQELRNALLEGSESVESGRWSPAHLRRIRDCLSSCFLYWDRRYAKPWRPRVFRDIYMVASFVLKVEATYTPEQERKYLERFLQNEESCRSWRFADFARTELFRLARSAVRSAGKHLHLDAESLIGSCRHGPGAVSEGFHHADKNVWSEIFSLPKKLGNWATPRLFFANEELLNTATFIEEWKYRLVIQREKTVGPDCFGYHWSDDATLVLSRQGVVPGAGTIYTDVLEFHVNVIRFQPVNGFLSVDWCDTTLMSTIAKHIPSFRDVEPVDVGGILRLYRRFDHESVPKRVVARLSLVPKDWKGPRGVFIHPKAAVWCQLGIWETISSVIRKTVRGSSKEPLTWLGVCYDPRSQEPSRVLALESSVDRRYATLDLSDASDRIPATLVRGLFHNSHWRAFDATRASAIQLPGRKTEKKLWMFAPMGDAKTFPVLTIVCAAVSVAALAMRAGYTAARPPSENEWKRLASRLRVFGDDIIVETEAYGQVCAALSSANLKVNERKSFHRGFFRESCGMDAYRGLPVTPVRLRFEPIARPDVATVQKAVDLHNRLCLERPDAVGLIKHLERYVQRSRYDTGYTANTEVSPHLLFSYADQVFPKNWERPRTRFAYNLALQRWEYEVYTEAKDNYLTSENPWWDLNHWLLTASQDDCGDAARSERMSRSSPVLSAQWEEIPTDLKRAGGALDAAMRRALTAFVTSVRRPTCSRSWVPVVGCTIATKRE